MNKPDFTPDVTSMKMEISRLTAQLVKTNDRVAELESIVRECDEYLDINRYTAIGNMSILHRKMKELRKN